MTLGVVEALINTMGEELTEAAGIQSTRLTQQFLPEDVEQNGINNMAGTAGEIATAVAVNCTWAGTTTVLCTNTAGVTAGKWLRLDSDGQVFEITLVVPNVSFTLLNPAGLSIPSGSGASSWLVPTVLTLTGAFSTDIIPGMRFRVTSGALLGDEALVNSRDSGTQVTLRNALHIPPTVLTAASWEIVTDAQTTAIVENTLGWPASGQFFIEGIRYRYSAKTPTTFSGVEWYNNQFWVDGAKKLHGVTVPVVDFSRNTSRLDEYWRSFLVEYATGFDLDVVGANIGTLRPVTITSDDTYRELIKAISYTPRGTVYAAELALEALLGETVIQATNPEVLATASGNVVTLSAGTFAATVEEGHRFRIKTEGTLFDETVLIDARLSGTQIRLKSTRLGDFSRQQWEITEKNWVLFEDLTVGSLNHAARVYMTGDPALGNTVSEGKTFLEGAELTPATSTTEVPIDNPHIQVSGVRWAPESGPWLIDEGLLASSTDSGVTITGPASQFSANIMPGDLFELHQRGPANLIARVVSRDSDTQLTLGHLPGFILGHDDLVGKLGVNVAGAAWKVWRERTNCNRYKPSLEVVIAYPGDSGTTQWQFIGDGDEGVDITTGAAGTRGPVLQIRDNGDDLGYRHPLRIEPESKGTFEIHFDHNDSLLTGTTGRQMCFVILDGEKAIAVGMNDDGAGAQNLGFISQSGAFIGPTPVKFSGTAATTFDPGFNTVRVIKDGRNDVNLYRQASNASGEPLGYQLALTIPYATLADVATWNTAVSSLYAPDATSTKEIFFGNLNATGAGPIMYVKHVDWNVQPVANHWNTVFPDCSISGTTLTDDSGAGAPQFEAGDVGKLVRITDFGAITATGGNSLGEWEIASYTDVSNVDLVGVTRGRGGFTNLDRSRLVVRDSPCEFTWPNDLGRSIEILTGVHAGGVYAITGILDPVSFVDFDTTFPLYAANRVHAATKWDSAAKIQLKMTSNVVLLNTAGGAPALPSGFTVEQAEVDWRFVPNFVVDAGVVATLVGTGEDLLTIPTTRGASFAVGDLMEILRSRVLTGQIHDKLTRNDTTPAPYKNYPFYLYDSFGGARDIFDDLLAAAILPRFDEFFVDAAGIHILE